MNFLDAAQKQIDERQQQKSDPIRLTLQFLKAKGIGAKNARSIKSILEHLKSKNVVLSRSQFQQQVLGESRKNGYFIGSFRRGCFLIATPADAWEMVSFYNKRIKAESEHRKKLLQQCQEAGMDLTRGQTLEPGSQHPGPD